MLGAGPLPGFTVTGLSNSSASPGICYLPLTPVGNKLSSPGNCHFGFEKVVGVIDLLLRWIPAGPPSPRVQLLLPPGVLAIPSLHGREVCSFPQEATWPKGL